MSREPIVVVGAGGHGKVVVSTALAAGIQVESVFDDRQSLWGGSILGVPVRGPVSACEAQSRPGVVGVGDNEIRKELSARLKIAWVSLVHPSAVVHPSVVLGPGTVVFANATIQPDSKTGVHVIINSSATVDHDCLIGDFVHIGPGSNLAGNVTIHRQTFLGIGVSVIPGVSVGENSIVGAGATVIGDLPAGITAIGTPAKILRGRRC